jgi:hypothetical protein
MAGMPFTDVVAVRQDALAGICSVPLSVPPDVGS